MRALDGMRLATKKGREINLHSPLDGDISSQANKKAVGSDAHGLDSSYSVYPVIGALR